MRRESSWERYVLRSFLYVIIDRVDVNTLGYIEALGSGSATGLSAPVT
jgi:hypothetical protein